MIEDAQVPILLQRADEAYRNAPDAPDCASSSITTSWLWQHSSPSPPPPRAVSMSSSASSTADTEETTSWANFPVCMRTEQHPSMLSLNSYLEEQPPLEEAATPELDAEADEAPQQPQHQPQQHGEEESPDDTDFFIAPNQLLKLNRIISFNEASSEASASATFGWGDFPLVAQQHVVTPPPSFDYPWRYYKADEDEEIVPLAAPPHLKPTVVVEVTNKSTGNTKTNTTAADISLSPSHKNNSRTVSFGQVHIREYRECLGDHPWCPQYPVSLDWSYDPARDTVVDVDVYEEQARETCCWSSTPRRMEVLERRCRLARAMRVSKAEMDVMEAYRQEQVVQAEEEQVMAVRGGEHGGGEEEDSAAMTPTTALLHRIPTMLVLPHDKSRKNENEPSVCFLELEVADD